MRSTKQLAMYSSLQTHEMSKTSSGVKTIYYTENRKCFVIYRLDTPAKRLLPIDFVSCLQIHSINYSDISIGNLTDSFPAVLICHLFFSYAKTFSKISY